MAKTMASKGAKQTRSAQDSEAAWVAMLLNHPVLSHEETNQLITRSQTGCRRSRDRLVRHNMRLIVSIAKRYARKDKLQLGDLINEGAMGLMHCIDEFDVNLGFKLSTYGNWWIRQSVSRAIENHARIIRIPVHFSELLKKINRIKGKILSRTGNENPEPAEILTALDMDVTETNINNVIRLTGVAIATPRSLCAELLSHHGGDVTILDQLASSDNNPEEEVHRQERVHAMCQALGTITERQLEVVTKRILDERTLEDISRDPGFNVTRERIRQIEAKALKKLRTALEAIPK